MNDEVKQGETIQSAEQQESERATAAQVTQRDPGPPAAPADERRDGAAAQQPAQTTSESATSQDAEDAAAERSAATGETPSDPQAGDQAGDDENPEFRELQEALAEGRDLSTELEAPAAGQGGGTSDSIAAGVRFERDPNARDPQAGFDPDYSPPPLPDPTADTNLVAEAVVPPPPPPPDNGVAIGGLTPAVEGGDVSVNEANLSDGSAPNPPALTQTGSFTVSAPDGLGSLTLGGVLVLDANGLTGNPVTTPLGNTLVVTGYDPETGTVTYEYTLGDNESHPQGQGTNDLFDNLPVVLTDSDGDTTEEVLAVRVIDDIPDAISDIDEVGTGGSTGGNVFTGTDDDALDRVEADVPGADRTGSPITGVIAGEHLDAPITDGSGVGAVINGQFGTLVLNADGSYVYTANGGLTSNQTEVFTYTLTDADDDTDTATLTISVGDGNTPTGGTSTATVDDDGLVGGNALSTLGDIDANQGDDSNPSEAIYSGTLEFTPGGDIPVSIDFASMALEANGGTATTGGTAMVGQETVEYQWSEDTGTLTARISSGSSRTGTDLFKVEVNSTTGAYTVTLLDNVLHAVGGNDETSAPPVALTYTITDNDGSPATGTLNITFNDDAPSASDFDGTLLNEPTQVLSGLIDYGLGADGFGEVALSFDGASSNGSSIALTSNGAAVSVASIDTNSDGLEEVLGFVDNGSTPGVYDSSDQLVFSLAPTEPGEAYGEYALTLHDVLDLQAEAQTFTVGSVQAGAPTTGIVINDGNGGSIGVLATPESGHQVNSNTGELGVDNTILNADEGGANYDEKISLAFGTEFSGTAITEKAILNDVRITGVDVGSGTDSFNWVALKDGLEVGTGSSIMDTVNGKNLIGDPIHVEGGYDTLVLTMVSGDFKMSGFTYSQQGESFDAILNFSYTATDGDTDAVSGDFSVTVTDDAGAMTALAPGAGDFAAIINTSQDQMTV